MVVTPRGVSFVVHLTQPGPHALTAQRLINPSLVIDLAGAAIIAISAGAGTALSATGVGIFHFLSAARRDAVAAVTKAKAGYRELEDTTAEGWGIKRAERMYKGRFNPAVDSATKVVWRDVAAAAGEVKPVSSYVVHEVDHMDHEKSLLYHYKPSAAALKLESGVDGAVEKAVENAAMLRLQENKAAAAAATATDAGRAGEASSSLLGGAEDLAERAAGLVADLPVLP